MLIKLKGIEVIRFKKEEREFETKILHCEGISFQVKGNPVIQKGKPVYSLVYKGTDPIENLEIGKEYNVALYYTKGYGYTCNAIY